MLTPGAPLTYKRWFDPIEQEQLAKLDGERGVLFGEIYDAGQK
jgi:hypothetical protein